VRPQRKGALAPGETYSVRPERPHLITNGSETSATFLILQGFGEYDFVPLVLADIFSGPRILESFLSRAVWAAEIPADDPAEV
jgi:hypothetical protein